ncbi:hypothetical protein GCM10018790_00740 [Kitasatospora xanthocidica]|uniref:DUF3592 domain-containing protein n=1 Tax=Kitasatospora xanthocidica TaxID=83382 RepID=UPI0016777DF3|nr:DUF3592 domain-containing protein [Kitasatospora xanthocidica]GHF27330.1 hypothetical protein GCM10018790_00740 [Kitasatospora xanthocidica]
MDTTTATVGGLVLALFGGVLLLWCAAEVRLRLRVRRRGVPAVATVLAEENVHGQLDSAPLLSFSVPPSVGGPGGPGGPGGCGIAGLVLARPRGHTPLRRPDRFAPGASVRICYDPRDPGRVVLAPGEISRVAVADLLWSALGVACLAAGAGLLAAVGG